MKYILLGLRGHSPQPERRGDIDYLGQFEDDLADLVTIIHEQNSDTILIVGEHSSGGGLAIRFTSSRYGDQADDSRDPEFV